MMFLSAHNTQNYVQTARHTLKRFSQFFLEHIHALKQNTQLTIRDQNILPRSYSGKLRYYQTHSEKLISFLKGGHSDITTC